MKSIKSIINRTIVPRSLYTRSLIIIILPIIVLQLVISYVFYNRHLDSVTKSLSRNVASSLSLLSDSLDNIEDPLGKQALIDLGIHSLDLDIELGSVLDFEPGRFGLSSSAPMKHIDDKIIEAFESSLDRPFMIDLRPQDDEVIDVVILLKNKALGVKIPKDRITSTSTQLLFTWMMLTALVLTAISIYYMKLQVMPIRRLAKAMSNFGKGRDPGMYNLEGPLEVKRVAQAFNRMRSRILRQIGQRTELLAAVSHDLRTPLTRMRLALEVLPPSDKELESEFQYNISEMNKLVDLYLSFARGEGTEKVQILTLSDVIEEVLEKFQVDDKDMILRLNSSIRVPVRPFSFKRCMLNIIENAMRYGSAIRITLKKLDDNAEVVIEDNGIGVPEHKYQDIIKPFVTLDGSEKDGGNVGLGLAIAHDIILGHGGELELGRSKLGGLKVMLKLPL